MTGQQRELLESWIRAKTTPQRVAFRSKICLLAADGMSATDIAHHMNTTRPTVLLWRKRFDEQGPEGLTKDAPRGPSPRRLDDTIRQAIVDTTLNSTPPDAPQWTTRTLAKALGVSNATVARIWKTLKIGPKRKSGKSPKEDRPKQRHAELVGVYLAGSLKALVVSVTNAASSWAVSKTPTGIMGHALNPDGVSSPGDSDCRFCLSEAIALVDGAVSSGSITSRLDGMSQFLQRTTLPNGAEYYVFVEGEEWETKLLEDWWTNRPANTYIRTFPCGHFGVEGVAELVARCTGVRQPQIESFRSHGFVGTIDQFLQDHNGSAASFVWTRRAETDNAKHTMCKVMLETIRSMAAFIVNREWTKAEKVHGTEEELMNWKQKLESWFTAVAFAEEGEHKTALDIAANPIPQPTEAIKILPSLSTTFAAAAFAEENCHEYAAEILYGVRRKSSLP